MAKKSKTKPQVLGFIGLGLDHQGEEKRLTTTGHFVLLGGSKETHEQMQDTAIRFDEELRRRGKALQDIPVEEVLYMFHETQQ